MGESELGHEVLCGGDLETVDELVLAFDGGLDLVDGLEALGVVMAFVGAPVA